ncbi:conserved hypothetical protein [Methanococcus maripaludis C5]|uniref:Uncharacterized protein n=1 Tax=Methanococcus maripaludis (strain C5 / ATCC BAA-1333) TaxID=402880 RepID=A4G0K0_METM5|nr:hypothetical protein [Methanococcus maripaludis]ABO35984.1 conserved hypothetical protein [Methanococcus maripaludis C5]
MQKVAILLFILVSTVSMNYAADSDGIEIYKIWATGDSTNSQKIYLDLNNPSLNIGLVNTGPYQKNIKVEAKCEDETWESPIISLSPNSHSEKIVELRIKFTEIGEHTVDISLTDEYGKSVGSQSVRVNVISPIDVKNITCQESFISGTKSNLEIVNDNWYTVTLKSNAKAQSDYEVKTWIYVVSKGYSGDPTEEGTSGNINILYDGQENAKTVYVPYHSEVELSFKIPEIISEDEDFKLQVHTEVMGLHDYTDGIEETTLVNSGGSISYTYKKTVKEFKFPIGFVSFSEFKDLNGTSEDYVSEFYKNSKIYDEKVESYLNDRIVNENVLPRAYVEEDPFISILRIEVNNRFDKKLDANMVLQSHNGYNVTKTIKIDPEESKTIYMPYFTKLNDENDFDIFLYSNSHYIYTLEKSLNIDPEIVTPVVFYNISLPNDELVSTKSDLSANVLVGKNYTAYVSLKNNYNRTLTGKLYVGEHYASDDIYESDVFESSEPITFKLGPKEVISYPITLKFNKELNGPIEFVYEVQGPPNNEDSDISGHSTFCHVNAYNALDIRRVEYNNTILPKIATLNENSNVFAEYPIAGFNNSCMVSVESCIPKDIAYKMWVDVYDSNGELKAISNEKIVVVKSKNVQEINFEMFFEEGFLGYTLFHAIPLSDFENVEILYTEGSGTVSKAIDPTAPIGRYSKIDLMGRVPTSTTEVTEIVAPIKIEDMTYSENNLDMIISSGLSSIYPVNLSYYYRVTISTNNETIYKSPTYKDIIHSTESKPLKIKLGDVDGENYNIVFEVEIPDFAKESGKYYPMTLKKSLNIYNNQEITFEETTAEDSEVKTEEVAEEITEASSNSDDQSNNINEDSGIIGSIMDKLGSFASKIPIIKNLIH